MATKTSEAASRRKVAAERRRRAAAERLEADRRVANVMAYRAFVLRAVRGEAMTAEQKRELAFAMDALCLPPYTFARDVRAVSSWPAADMNGRAVLFWDHPQVFDDVDELLRRWKSKLDLRWRATVPHDG